MTVNLSMLAGAGAQFFDNNGVILSGGLVYTYAAGTTTPQTTYTTSAGNVAHTNPIVLDSAGRVASGGEIWLTDAVAYKFVLKTSAAVTIGTYDNVTGNGSGVASGIYATFAASSGSSLVGYLPPGTGAVATTVQAKLRQYISVMDFGATGNGITDDTTAINVTVNAVVAAGGGTVFFPAGTYLISSTISQETGANKINFVGSGVGTTIIKTSSVALTNMFVIRDCSNFNIRDLTIDPNNSPSANTAPYFPLYIFNCNYFNVSNVEVIHYKYQGITIADSAYFRVENCRVSKDTVVNTEHYAIHISAQVAVQPHDAIITNNIIEKSIIFFDGSYSEISNNIVRDSGFGAGIATSSTSAVGGLTPQQNIITGNICYNGTGIDASSVAVQGLEIGSQYSVISNNICYNNAGQGISFFGKGSTVTNNVCFNNGTAVYQPLTRAGITAAYATASINASFSVVSNNRCFDTGGALGTQEYGYTESAALLNGMVLSGNNFQGNALGQTIISGTSFPTCSYDGTNSQVNYPYTPGAIAAGASSVLITEGGASLGDFVMCSFDLDINGINLFAYVYAVNSIRVVFYNYTGGTVTLGAGIVRLKVIEPYK
jgi:parallel beta-helix repeat protein